MEVFATTNSGSQNGFEWDDGHPQSGHHAGQTLRSSHRSDTMEAEAFNLFSPQASGMMDFNTDQTFAFDSAASDFSSQMSQPYAAEEFLHQDNYILAAQFLPGSNTTFESSPAISNMSFDQTSQAYPSHFNTLAHHHNDPNQDSQAFFTNGWINGPMPVPIKNESISEEDLISPSTLHTQPMQGPWSSEVPSRFAEQPLPQQNPWSLSVPSNNMNPHFASYAPSVLSSTQDSSPLIEGMHTPDSANRSPLFSTAAPNSSAGSSNGGDMQRRAFHSFDQTPRPLQTSFAHQSYIMKQDMSPNTIDPNTIQSARREPSHSPSSDYVLVDISDAGSMTYIEESRPAPSQSKQKKPSTKRSRATSSATRRPVADNFVSEYPPHAAGPIRRQSSNAVSKATKDGHKRVGGRSLGMHLTEEAAARAKQLRDEGSCWICCFQRDSCSPGVECDRCQKRHLRNQMEHGLGCDRTKLNDLRPYFIPAFLAGSGDQTILKQFMANHVRHWHSKPFKIRIKIIWDQDPMTLELYEFVPKGAELARHLHNVVNKETGKREWKNLGSPPLAMVQVDSLDRRSFEKYIDDIVNSPANLERFVERCYKFENDNFQRRLFRLMYDYQPTSPGEKALWKDIMRLQIITYIYCRASTVHSEDLPVLSTLQFARANRVKYSKNTTIRLANRQLKYLYTSLWTQNMESVLKRLQQVLRSSSGGSKWSSGFVAVLGLGMAFETIQLVSHTHFEADHIMGNTTSWVGRERAEKACRVIDEKFFFLTTLFRWKYHRGFNPFKNIHDRAMHQTLGPKALELVEGVNELVTEKVEFLSYKENVPILNENKEKYTSRLVAKFLMGFWKPTA